MGNEEVTEDAVKEAMMDEKMLAIKNNMAKIKHKIVVIFGKGGVGKTTF